MEEDFYLDENLWEEEILEDENHSKETLEIKCMCFFCQEDTEVKNFFVKKRCEFKKF